jgi:hypothetical protein
MKRTSVLLSVLCLFVLAPALVASAQQLPNIAGDWSATTRMPDRNVSERWTFQQAGGAITGSLKTDHGDLPVTGTIDDVGFIRIEVKGGDMDYKVRATLDKDSKDSMDGSILIGKKEYLWSAKLSK